MKKIALAVVLAAGLSTVSMADELYVSGEAGVNQTETWDSRTDFSYGLGFGLDSGMLRAEVTYLSLDTENVFGEVDADGVFATVFLEHTFEGGITPYVGVGPGWVWTNDNGFEDEGMAWSFVGGVSADVVEGVALFGQYRYVVSPEAQTWFGDYEADVFTGGLRVAL